MSAATSTPVIDDTIEIEDDEEDVLTDPRVPNAKIADKLFHEKIGDYRRCKTCDQAIKQVGSNKSALTNHVTKKHPIVWNNAVRTVQDGSKIGKLHIRSPF